MPCFYHFDLQEDDYKRALFDIECTQVVTVSNKRLDNELYGSDTSSIYSYYSDDFEDDSDTGMYSILTLSARNYIEYIWVFFETQLIFISFLLF